MLFTCRAIALNAWVLFSRVPFNRADHRRQTPDVRRSQAAWRITLGLGPVSGEGRSAEQVQTWKRDWLLTHDSMFNSRSINGRRHPLTGASCHLVARLGEW